MKLLKHSVYNLLGLGLPLVVAVFTIPMLIKGLGDARFGLLTLIWAVVSYFGLFDLGLGRALTQQLAVVLANNEHKRVGPIVGTTTVIMAVLGVIAGIAMAAAAPWGVGLIKAVPDRQDAIRAVYAMALGMPAIVLTSGFRGILEARHAFGVINLIRLPMGLFTFLGPVAVVLYGQPRLEWIAEALVVGRIVACVVHAYYAWRALPSDRGSLSFQFELLKPLCVSGGWMTVSNIISPLMGYVDRFVIGAIVSSSAVAYYATPQELVTKVWIVPGALTAVLFPAFSAHIARRDAKAWLLFTNVLQWLFLAMLPFVAVLILFANTILSLWVGPMFAQQSTVLMQMFAVGMLMTCLAQIPFTVIQSANKAQLTALIHCVELPFFLFLLWWLTSRFGTLGAACAWLLRVIFDTAFMFQACMNILNQPVSRLMTVSTMNAVFFAGLSLLGIFLPEGAWRVFWISGIVVAAAVLSLRLAKAPITPT